jgi:sulfate/thiosulfate-binding protein
LNWSCPLKIRNTNWKLVLSRLAISSSVCLALVFIIWPWLPWNRQGDTRTIVVYGFSILSEVMNDQVLPAFQAEWLQQTGEKIEFITSFAGSGTITNQVILGVPADIVILSTELDAYRLVENGVLRSETWQQLPHGGIINRTPFIILVRPGNPKNIQGFEDLTRPNIDIVHPDPLTSGGAQWAILAEYGSVEMLSGSQQMAYDQLLGIWKNVVAQAASARAARTQFENGFGDALITYEQEALHDRALGRLNAEIVYPQSTILSEHTVVEVEKNIEPEEQAVIQALVNFLFSEDAQRLFVQGGYRSVIEDLNQDNPYFGNIARPFLVADLGGWRQVKREIIDAIWKERILTELNR